MTDFTAYESREEADAVLAAYERDRCACGGSPAWWPPEDQRHLADCPNVPREDPHEPIRGG